MKKIAIAVAIVLAVGLVVASSVLAGSLITGNDRIDQEYVDLGSDKPQANRAVILINGEILENVKAFSYSIERNDGLAVCGTIVVYGEIPQLDQKFLLHQDFQVQIHFGTDSSIIFDECYCTNLSGELCDKRMAQITEYTFHAIRARIS